MARFAGIAGMTLLTLGGSRRDLLSAVIAAERTVPAATDPAGARMAGGGSLTDHDLFVTHGFELHCDPENPPNTLDIEWEGNLFHMEALASARCTDDPAIQPDGPSAAFNTCHGEGSGRFNGQAGATATWTFTDAGASGVEDRAAMTVKDASGAIVLQVSGTLTYGNHEAIGQ